MSNYKTMSSYDAYYKNIRDMANSHTNYYMANTDLGNGQALPEYQKQERIPTKVKRRLLNPETRLQLYIQKEFQLILQITQFMEDYYQQNKYNIYKFTKYILYLNILKENESA